MDHVTQVATALRDMQKEVVRNTLNLMTVQYGDRIDAVNGTIRSIEKRFDGVEDSLKEIKDCLKNGNR